MCFIEKLSPMLMKCINFSTHCWTEVDLLNLNLSDWYNLFLQYFPQRLNTRQWINNRDYYPFSIWIGARGEEFSHYYWITSIGERLDWNCLFIYLLESVFLMLIELNNHEVEKSHFRDNSKYLPIINTYVYLLNRPYLISFSIW